MDNNKNGLRPHDPFNDMLDEEKQSIRPDYLGSGGDSETGSNGRIAEGRKRGVVSRQAGGSSSGGKNDDNSGGEYNDSGDEARNRLNDAENVASAAAGGYYRGGGQSLKNSEEKPSNFSFHSSKKGGAGKKNWKSKMAKFSATAVLVFAVLVFLGGSLIFGSSIFTIGSIDLNLQDATKITQTVAILEQQGTYVIQDEVKNGDVSNSLSDMLASQGMMVGQLAENGDFIKTNTYIADIERLKDVAVLGNFQVQPSAEGELAILYDGRVIKADDFVATVESEPKMYAAYSKAVELGARYYYGDDSINTQKNAGINMSIYGDWNENWDEEKKREEFKRMTDENLDGGALNVNVGATVDQDGGEDENKDDDDECQGGDGDFDMKVGGGMTATLACYMRHDSEKKATDKAAQIMNAGVSAGEVYRSMRNFMTIMQPLQEARIYGTGPVHQLLNYMYDKNEVSYTDMHTGETITDDEAILTTGNFVAAVSAGRYSAYEAANVSRDRILLGTGYGTDDDITDTVIDTRGQAESLAVLKKKRRVKASKDDLAIAEGALEVAVTKQNSELGPTSIGGQYSLEGGVAISNLINRAGLGGMGANQAELAEYHRVTDKIIARKAEAERATRSPFDITSRYTFLGSMAHNMASMMIRSRSTTNGAAGATIDALAKMTEDSVGYLSNNVVADGIEDSYDLTYGENCMTVGTAREVEGDLYCTSQSIVSMDYMENGEKDWEGMRDNGGYKKFVTTYMDRMTTIGVKDKSVCEAAVDEGGFLTKLIDFFARVIGGVSDTYNGCNATDDNIATGAKYTFTDQTEEDVKKFSAFARYDQVKSLLDDTKTTASKIREEYYAKHPRDNSREGFLARISGLSKKEAKILLAYSDYLVALARYNPAERYAFASKTSIEIPEKPLVEHSNQLASEMYVVWHGRTEYDDLRGRTRVA